MDSHREALRSFFAAYEPFELRLDRLEQWDEGRTFVAGLVAQDVQDALLASAGRWPLCRSCESPPHALYVEPDIGGPDPHWVCEESGTVVAPLGGLA